MKKSLIWIAALSATMALPSAASACDLHGPGAFGGMHRFNPFAKAIPLDRPPSAPIRAASPRQSERADRERSEERSQALRSENAQTEPTRRPIDRQSDSASERLDGRNRTTPK